MARNGSKPQVVRQVPYRAVVDLASDTVAWPVVPSLAFVKSQLTACESPLPCHRLNLLQLTSRSSEFNFELELQNASRYG
jgi:hypothetical protein